jgi:hypothetical protein
MFERGRVQTWKTFTDGQRVNQSRAAARRRLCREWGLLVGLILQGRGVGFWMDHRYRMYCAPAVRPVTVTCTDSAAQGNARAVWAEGEGRGRKGCSGSAMWVLLRSRTTRFQRTVPLRRTGF